MSQTSITIPDSVRGEHPRDLYARANQLRVDLKTIAAELSALRKDAAPLPAIGEAGSGVDPEVIANVTLTYRAIEDASMRLGKAMQALDGGVSVYDKASTVGA
jgi:hypothetical protein